MTVTERENARQIVELKRELLDLRRSTGNLPVRFGKGGGGLPLRWGKAKADWSGGNTIDLAPVRSPADATATGEADVAAQVVSPAAGTPRWLEVKTDDVLAYVTTGTGQALLLPLGEVRAPEAVTVGTASTSANANPTMPASVEAADKKTVTYVRQTRSAYEAATKTLWAFYRTEQYICGRLVTVSGETRVAVFVAEPC